MIGKYIRKVSVVGDDSWPVEIGINGCVRIEEHPAQGDGDRWFYDVIYDDGHVLRLFTVDCVWFDRVEGKP